MEPYPKISLTLMQLLVMLQISLVLVQMTLSSS